ncbi:MAG: hypothetical protein Q4F66_12650 [Clostridium sp.]|nr:hypothetical protein [Clostridium sp.]
MALFYMSVQFYITLALGVICLLPLVFNNGAMIKNKFVWGFIAIVTLMIGMINYTSLPENYLIQKVAVCLAVIMAEAGLFMNNKYPVYEKLSKVLIAAGLLGNILLLVV